MCVCVLVCLCTGSSDVGTPSDCCFAAGQREAICNITIVSETTDESDKMFSIRVNLEPGQYICEVPGGLNTTVTNIECKCSSCRLTNRLPFPFCTGSTGVQ